ncbi:hypothetical protein [Caulobacter mirabilis]|uniref:Uncharacterized protein n=1 Tax=Caulobacter mirabilis TaxID=69666 RepID=A0A2D2B3G9_9CAUL|nr:hypothetical protein [Caulobacter mirabilis]ATQ44777.1 hypothetical protein CSW64_21500 [Caulobacter mirabilis]
MSLLLHEPLSRGGERREMVARLFAVTSVIYALLALLTGAVAAAGLFGLAGLGADPGAADAARLLGLPWSLAVGLGADDRLATLLLALGALGLNLALLAAATRAIRGRRRRG